MAPLLGTRARTESEAPAQSAPAPVQPAPAPVYSSDAARLAAEIEGLAPDKAVQLLTILKRGLEPQSSEFERYLSAEALTTAIYPTFKFSEFARIFLEDEAFLAYYMRFMDVGNWHSLDRKYAMNELLKLVLHLDGDAAECGTYKGATAYLLCRAFRKMPISIHLFDSFEGLSEPTSIDGTYWRKGSLTAAEDELRQSLREFDNYRIYKGWIPTRFVEAADCRFRFVHIDVDLYQPTLDSLQFFYPRMVAGGIILLDDHGFKSCPGAKQAADAFFESKAENLALLPTGQAFTIKQ
ncbi:MULTISPECIES: TylF/MycF/NovP-related O-methyltransferase [unclassified Bradyrhizobium]|uniref:TylF/MycF/NovP-related O-methyltransferase n=1 Tax=unclassified Bradyrhizobium TaxID=2631580 RepID=UPI001FF9E7A8|nr:MULTISPECIES: TylF/MycF/NovP-related O-methyltransferase [unclassified Bradyrhizobium]MCK1519563.1 class I SAM-dependent methyltransferase [Bradyrhizobium sp. 17]MCK1605946.1 class I SAM-dependent methyltransferase [Bradyrhizobium sp. 166]MCK1691100.1 class I SAM-dependent methyltransferase [Bradyrhizobium sp. 145]